MFDIQKQTLPSKIRVVTGSMAQTEAVTILFLFRVGSRNESDEIAGISHLFEHMLFKGTKNYPSAREVAEQVEAVGGIFNAFTDREVTGYWCKMPRRHYQRGLKIISDMVIQPLLEKAELEREKGVVFEEIRAYNDSPSSRADLLLTPIVWRDHPLGRDIAGSVESVTAVSRDDMQGYLDTHYVASNMVVAVTGNVNHQDIADQVAQLMGDFRQATPPAPLEFQNSIAGPRVNAEKRSIEQVRLSMGLLVPSMNSTERYPLSILSTVLGESMGSRLFAEVREKRGLAYDIHSGVHYLTDTGVFEVECGIPPAKVKDALQVIVDQLALIRDEEITDKEYTQALDLIEGRTALRMEETRAVAQFVGMQETLRGEIISPEQILANLKQVSKEQIKAVARKYFTPDNTALALVGAVDDTNPLLKILQY